MKSEYEINDTFDNSGNRPVGKIYHRAEIYLIETFIEAKRKYIAALLEFNEKYPKYMNFGYKIEKINNLIYEKNKTLKEIDKTFNKIFKKSKLCNLKAELIKLQEEKELENSSLSNLKSRLIELEAEIIKQHEICLKYYCQLNEFIDWLIVSDLDYLFKKYNIFLEKSDNNYFNEEMEMKAVLRDYLYTDSYLIVDQIPTKRLAK